MSRLRDNAYKIYLDTLKGRSSVHEGLYDKMEKYYFLPEEESRKWTLPPEAVVAKLLLALESSHPKAHYYVGLPAYGFAWLRRFLSDSALDWVIGKVSEKEGRDT